MTVALSTSWFAKRFGSSGELLQELANTGFEAVCLAPGSIGFSPHMLLPTLRKRNVALAAVEDPFDGVPSGESGQGRHLASAQDAPRRRSLERALRTSDAASATGSSLVIVYGGRLAVDVADQEATLRRGLGREDRREELETALAEIQRIVAIRRDAHLDRLSRSLFELCRLRPETVWCLTLSELPSEVGRIEHLEMVFEAVGRRNLRYWHDCGAAQIRRHFGEGGQESWLEAFGPRLAGVHLHDFEGSRSGRPPGSGEVDFQLVRSFLTEEVERVVSLSPEVDLEGLRLTRLFLEKYRY